MSEKNFEGSLSRVLSHEGGYTNHPSDPGGPTNFGITIHDYRKYINPKGTANDVRTMKLSDAKKIYRANYWDSQKCSDLPTGVDYSAFDYGVNSGVGRSGKVLRKLVGMPTNTSVVNAEVLAAVARRDKTELVKAINAERLAFLKSLKTWPTFGGGWGRRVSEVLAWSLSLIKGEAAKPVTPPVLDVEAAKGIVADPKKTKQAVAAGVPSATAGAGTNFMDWISAHPIQASLILLSSIVIAAAIVYQINEWRRRKQERPMDVPVVPELVQ